MKDGIMKTNLVIFVIGSLLALAVVSCQSSRYDDTRGYSFQKTDYSTQGGRASGGPGGSGGRGQGGPGNQPPELSESTELLLKIETLINNPDPLLVISKDQESKIIPILTEWKNELQSNQDSASDAYIPELVKHLSVAQAEYKLQLGPPGGESGRPQGPPPNGGDSSDRPMMGPPSDLELLDNILEKLS